MPRFFLLLCLSAHVFAALPALGMAQGKELSSSVFDSEAEELLATFSLIGDSAKTPFILRITFETCNDLKDDYGNALPLTDLKLKYYKTELQAWETIDLEQERNLRTDKNLRQNKNSRTNNRFGRDKNSRANKTQKQGKRMRNCMHNIEFYEYTQEKYDMEIYASWNKLVTAGAYRGNAYINILPKP